MLNQNFVKEKLDSGQTVIGTWSIIPSPLVADILASSGLDFIIIDGEHGSINFETAQEMAMACSSRNVSPIMRIGGVIESDILRALDIGVHGIQVPNIEDALSARKVIHYAKYPPIGNRGFSPFTRAGNYSIESSSTLTLKANENTLIGLNIEGKNGIKNVDEILSIAEVNIVFIGLFDLSKSLGIPGEIKNPEVLELLKNLVNKINESGKFAGSIATCEDDIVFFESIGIKYILYLVDCEMLRNSYSSILKKRTHLR